MKPCLYQCKTGPYAGKWHLRLAFKKEGRWCYYHIGRFRTKKEAKSKMMEYA